MGWAPPLILLALAVVTAFRPGDGLLLFAALGPLATIIFVVVRGGEVNAHFAEAFTLAFLFGFAVRKVVTGRGPAVDGKLYLTALALVALILASGAVSTAIMIAEQPEYPAVEHLRSLLVRDYLIVENPTTSATLFAQGLLLMLAVATIAGGASERRKEAAQMITLAAAGAALFNVVRLIALALARPDPWNTFLTFVATLRVNVHYADLNAAGSYFALGLLVSAGLWRYSRALSLICAPLTAAGLWISGSRSALAAVLLVGAGAVLAVVWRKGRRGYQILVTAVVLAALATGAVLFYSSGAQGARHIDAPTALQVRASLAKGAFDMVLSAPLFGVGIGRYYALSAPYSMSWITGEFRENAHNNFLQILAELGVPGLALILAVVVFVLRTGWRARGSPAVPALLAGVGGYLLTCLAGHPLLVDAAAYPFWTAMGLVAAPALPTVARVSRRAFVTLWIFVALLALSLPLRIVGAREDANLADASSGFSVWHREPDGVRYRFAGGHAAFFAPTSARALTLPLRRGAAAAGTVEVRIFVDGREADRISLREGDGWRTIRLLLPPRETPFLRIELHTFIRGAPRPMDAQPTDRTGVLMVGRPEFEER